MLYSDNRLLSKNIDFNRKFVYHLNVIKKKIFYIAVGISTLSLGLTFTSIFPGHVQLTTNVEPTRGELESLDVRNLDDLVSKPAFNYPDPLYSFPKTGIYFSKIENASGQSIFQFDLDFEKRVEQKVAQDELSVTASASDQNIEFKKVKVKINNSNVVLRTDSVRGTRYIFQGEFKEQSYLESDYSRQVVLIGTLEKFVNSKKVSEISLEFWYAVGC